MKTFLTTVIVASMASGAAFAQLASDQPAPAPQTPANVAQTQGTSALPSAQPVSAGVTAPATTGDSSAVLASSQPASTAPKRAAVSVGPTVTASGGRVVAAPQAAAPQAAATK